MRLFFCFFLIFCCDYYNIKLYICIVIIITTLFYIMDLQIIKTKIPRGGYKEISKRTKISIITICKFFNGKQLVSTGTENKILRATAQYLKDLKDEKAQLLTEINNL